MAKSELVMLNISIRRNEEIIQREAQKAEFVKTWIGQKKSNNTLSGLKCYERGTPDVSGVLFF